MKTAHSTSWKSSVQPRKQRKYVHNASYHTKGAFLSAHLSKELRQKYSTRAVRVRSGDTVKILRGTHKGKQGKVERVDVRNIRLHVIGVETKKLQGGAASYPIRPSNCMIVDLAKDRKRFKSAQDAPAAKPAIKETKTAPIEVNPTKDTQSAAKK